MSPLNAPAARRAVKVVWGAALLVMLARLAAPLAAQRAIAADPASLGPIPPPAHCVGIPGPPRDVTFDVRGGAQPVASIAIDITATHAFVGDLAAELIAPSGLSLTLFSQSGSAAGADPAWGANLHLEGTYTFSDAATTNWDAAAALTSDGRPVVAAGAYHAPFAAMFYGTPATGRWTLRLTDRCETENGVVSAAALRVTTLVTTRR